MTDKNRRERLAGLLALGALASLAFLGWPRGRSASSTTTASPSSPSRSTSPSTSSATASPSTSTSSSSEPAPDTPAPGSANPSLPPGATPTTLVVLERDATGLSFVAAAEKPVRFVAPLDAAEPTAPHWRLEDGAGRALAEGPLELPHLCPCPAREDHARGCTVVPHKAVFRLKLPRLASRERLRLFDAERELASFDLEARS